MINGSRKPSFGAKHPRLKSIAEYVMIVFYAIVTATSFEIFVFPNNFAPSGLVGLATIVQYVFKFEVAASSLIINLPMLAVAFFLLGRRYTTRTLVHTLAFSATLLILERVDISNYAYVAEDTGGAILAAIAGAVKISGIRSIHACAFTRKPCRKRCLFRLQRLDLCGVSALGGKHEILAI